MNERKEAMKASLVQAESGASQTGLRSPEQGSTPGPWHAKTAVIPDNVGGYDVAIVARVNGTDAIIAECFEVVDFHTKMPVAANAVRIVQCVNSHDDLVAALERICHYY